MRIIDPYVMPPGEVARYLEVGVDRVRQLDAILKPVRRAHGRRYYDPQIVEAYIQARDEKRRPPKTPPTTITVHHSNHDDSSGGLIPLGAGAANNGAHRDRRTVPDAKHTAK